MVERAALVSAVRLGNPYGGLNRTRSAFPRRSVGTRRASGFTLLEMLLVLFLMALVASAGLMLTEGVEDQAKYDETKRRMEMIRKAIVGDPTRTVNGGPEISGFVADMGRLPGCLAELLVKPDQNEEGKYLSPCDLQEIELWHPGETGIWAGWRGPYIQVLPERNGNIRFRDGYGNTGTDVNGSGGTNPDAFEPGEDERNSGWTWQLVKSEENENIGIRLQSFGLDGTQKYPAGNMFSENENDKPRQLITEYDWKAQLPFKVNVIFKNQSGGKLPDVPREVVLLIYNNDFSSPLAESDPPVELQPEEIPANSIITKDFNFPSFSGPIAIGSRPYVVACKKWDHDHDPDTPDEYTAFLGSSCSAESINKDVARVFSVVPRQALHLNLDWIIE
jgi:prepilin-type N-terminal cleavage/methylation domain-containing protein